MKRFCLTALAILSAFALLAAPLNPEGTLAATEPPPKEETIDPALQDAFQARVADTGEKVLGFLVNDVRIVDVQYSPDGSLALLWLGMFDSATGDEVASEPGLAVARLNRTDVGAEAWMVTLQADSDWQSALDQVPEDLLSADVRQLYEPSGQKIDNQIETYPGYKLPWAASVEGHLSQSISHDQTSCTSGLCHYAFDFSRVGGVANWPILAAKGGIVKYVKTNVPTRDSSLCPPDGTTGNYIVLEDRSTTPTTYQLYLHMAADSVPTSLRTPGAIANQGDYLGLVDNTGPSCGSHLHFQVQSSASSYLTNSVDITFDDVSINGGRPRTCSENPSSCSSTYVSGNVGTNPPSGSLSLPQAGSEYSSSTVTVAGNASDDEQVANIQVIARGMDGVWRDVGSSFNNHPFSLSVDLCSADVPTGPVDIAIRVWDNHGNVTVQPQGQRTILNNAACSTSPPCTLTANNIVLYSEPNYQGACREFDQSGFEVTVPNLDSDSAAAVGSNEAASIQVGSSTRVVLFDNNNYTGRNETLEVSDPNLADNLIGSSTVSSIKVQPTSMNSGDISTDPELVEPPPDSSILSSQSLIPRVRDSVIDTYAQSGAATYQIIIDEVNADNTVIANYVNKSGLTVPWLSIGSLPPGRYRIRIFGINNAGRSQSTGYKYFTVTADDSMTLAGAKSVPYSDSFDSAEADWLHDGLWTFTGSSWRYSNLDGTSYAGSGANSGSLTSPPITIPASGVTYLRFSYQYHTETTGPLWDQRHVQISENGGVFKDLPGWGQLYDDPQDYPLDSPAIDLSAYKGETVRFRFYFNTLDGSWNTGSGWEIKDFSVSSDAPDLSCAESTSNNSLATATSIGVGSTLSGKTICPAGDLDYYKFTGLAGERITASVTAKDIGSDMDPVLTLLDRNGSLITENDDRVLYEEPDSLLGAVLPYTGTYYLKVKSWDYPGSGGPSYFYTLRLMDDQNHPSVQITSPNQGWISNNPFTVEVNASDDGGVAKVDFYWHSSNWTGGAWQHLGDDADSSDGWSWGINPDDLPDLTGGGLYVQASDFSGNTWGDMLLNLAIDGIKPTSKLNSLSGTTQSTAVKLTWSASDAQSGLDHLEIQYKLDSGSWQVWDSQPASTTAAWFLGQSGHTYSFRAQAVDKAGNAEGYPSSAETSTTLNGACTPGANEPANNDQGGAQNISVGQHASGSFCQAADVDWYSVQLEGGKTYMALAASTGGGSAAEVQIFDSSNQPIAEKAAAGFGQSVSLLFTPPTTGTYTLRVAPLDDGLYGSAVTYSLGAFVPQFLYLPTVNH